MEALAPFLQGVELTLDQIVLDPNNPRFVGSDWTYVPEEDSDTEEVQKAVTERLFRNHDVKKLQAVIEANGYLPIDRVVVKKLATGKFVVLEGNRRICAAKAINGYADDGTPLPADVMETLKSISCLEYFGANERNEASWIFQGLRHISGVQEWPAFNKAKLLADEMEKSGLSYTDVGKKFGLSAFGAAQWVRGYFAFQQAKSETEYGTFIDERIYPYFQEIFGRSSIPLKEWLGWDDVNRAFANLANLNEFVGWFFPVRKSVEDEDLDVDREPTPSELAEAWERRRLDKRDDLRQLSTLISKFPKEFMNFRSGEELETVYSRAILSELELKFESEKDASERLFRFVDETIKLLENTPFAILSKEERKESLLNKLDEISRIRGELDKLAG